MRLVDPLLRKGVKVFDICFWVWQTFLFFLFIPLLNADLDGRGLL